MTQVFFAEKLGISDRVISKWETGKSMPDSGIMTEAYDKQAEENLLAMRREVEEKNRQMLRTEYW